MITKKRAQQIVDYAIKHAGKRVDGIEVSVVATDVATSRFANNEMTQNQSPITKRVSVRVLSQGRQIRLDSDDTTSKGVKDLVDRSISKVSLMEEDDLLPSLAEATDSARKELLKRVDDKVLQLTPEDRARSIKTIISIAEKEGLKSAGVYANGRISEAVGNSNGLFRFHTRSHLECSLTMTTPDSSGWAKAQGPLYRMVDAEKMGLSAAEKAKRSSNPKEIEPGPYTVILEHSAALDMLGYLLWDFSATSHLDKRSSLLDKIGTRVFGENINISDNAYQEEQAGPLFDGEGIVKQPVNLVEAGVLKNLLYGRRSAKRAGVESTGHSMPEPNAQGEFPMNLVVAGSNDSVDDLIAKVDRGVLLTRVWYVREVDPGRKIVTGMTRDGTFLVENGKIHEGIKNMRFNVSLFDLLSNVEHLGVARRTAGEETFPAVVPAMVVKNFNFTEVTRF